MMKPPFAPHCNDQVGASLAPTGSALRLSPHDLTGIRHSGSAAMAVDLAGWLRRIFSK